MKKLKSALSLMLALALALFMVPSTYATNSTYTYPVNGGNLSFDPTTGQITKCDNSVYEANIPEEIYGVPVTGIKRFAFSSSATKLLKVTVPSSISEIDESAFSNTYAKEIIISDGVTSIGGHAFVHGKNLTAITIPDSVALIGVSAFYGCTALKEIKLPASLKKLEKNVFYNCTALEEITLPDGLETIEEDAFRSCKALESLTVGPDVEYIGDYAFNGCKSLKAIYFQGDAPMIGKSIFGYSGIDGLIVYYPEGASGWSSPTWNGAITKSYKLSDNSTPTTPSNPDPVTPTQPQQPAGNTASNGAQVSGWAKDRVNVALSNSLAPAGLGNDYRVNITRAQFAATAVKLYEAMSGEKAEVTGESSFTDTTDPVILQAADMGFVSGVGGGKFDPSALVNREQAAVMLSSVFTKLGGSVPAVEATTFADNGDVSSWAKSAVAFMNSKEIVTGVGDNNFSPKGSASIEQALLISLKMFETLK